MTVESATYIDTLDPTLPLAGDPKSEGDNHLRLIKQVLKNTFPNVNGAIQATDENLDALRGLSGRLNLVINPHGSIQQQTTTPQTGAANYFADQWLGAIAAAGGAAEYGVLATGTVSDWDPCHMYFKTTTAKVSLAAGDGTVFLQPMEGAYTRRLRWGTANAKKALLRFRASASQSGVASFALRNGGNNRSYVQAFNVTTTPTDYSFIIDGDTSGTWAVDNTQGVNLSFCHSAGSSGQTATLGAWQAGNFFAANTQSNMLDTVNRQLNITDVMFARSDVLLPFEPIDFQLELLRCMRYFETGKIYVLGYQADPGGAGTVGERIPYIAIKRATPSITFANRSQAGVVTAAGTGLAFGDPGNGSFTAVYTTSGVGGYNAAETFTANSRF